jgi:hypothetical protein
MRTTPAGERAGQPYPTGFKAAIPGRHMTAGHVLAGLVPAVHGFMFCAETVDARRHKRAKRRRSSNGYGRAAAMPFYTGEGRVSRS